eukprot:jgi/Psemu1/64221/estExt_Genemark1.C_560116
MPSLKATSSEKNKVQKQVWQEDLQLAGILHILIEKVFEFEQFKERRGSKSNKKQRFHRAKLKAQTKGRQSNTIANQQKGKMNTDRNTNKISPRTAENHHQHLVVFDTMIDERPHHLPTSSPINGIKCNGAAGVLFHSQKAPPPSSWTSVKTFLQDPRKQENDDDALYWCE